MSNNTTWVAVERCHLCERTRKNFACCKCIKEGNFYSISTNDEDSFAAKRKKYQVTCEVSNEYKKKIENRLNEDKKYYEKNNELLLSKLRVECLKKVLKERKEHNEQQRTYNKKFLQKLVERKKIFERLDLKKEELRVVKINLYQKLDEQEEQEEKLNKKRYQLKKLQTSHVFALVRYIFPISERKLYPEFGTPSQATSFESEHDDVVSEVISAAELELKDATRIIHVDGHWIPQDFEETEYTIVDVGMPASQDFIKYYEWLKSYRNEPRKHESPSGLHCNAVLNVPASLVYTTQLMDGLSFFLGINLPNRVEYYDFSIFKVSRRKLFNMVNKLSQNVMYLCFSQVIPFQELNPQQMLHNLQMVVSPNNLNLGWGDWFNTEEYKLNESVFDDSDSSGEEVNVSDYDDDDPTSIDAEEWDKLLDMPSDHSEIQSDMPSFGSPREQSLSASATDLVSSAAASVISFVSWKR